MKTSTIILIAVGGIAAVYIVSRMSSSPAAVRRTSSAPSSSAYSATGSFIGGLIGGAFASHGAQSANNLSAGDQQIINSVTTPSGGVDLSGVYDNSGIVDTVGDVPS